MIRYRARLWGSATWTFIDVAEEDDNGVEAEVSGIIGSALSTSSLHVQRWVEEEEEWEDLE